MVSLPKIIAATCDGNSAAVGSGDTCRSAAQIELRCRPHRGIAGKVGIASAHGTATDVVFGVDVDPTPIKRSGGLAQGTAKGINARTALTTSAFAHGRLDGQQAKHTVLASPVA